jgi:hypothetical protein
MNWIFMCLQFIYDTEEYHLLGYNLKMEAICFSETSVDSQRTTWRYIPEDGTLHNHCCENFDSYIYRILFNKMASTFWNAQENTNRFLTVMNLLEYHIQAPTGNFFFQLFL